MLVKRSSKNQIAIPKSILERAGVGPADAYFRIDYKRGAIVLRPVEIEEKIPPEALERFETRMLKKEPSDREFRSISRLIGHLHHKRRR